MKIKELFKVADKRKILKFTIIAAGISLVVLLSVIGMTYATSVPKFCASCHIMKPEYVTWQHSSHSQVSCIECHVDSGLTSALKHKVVATKELYSYLFKKYELPIQATEKIPDSRCLKCHSLKRTVSPSYPDLNIPHERHNTKGVACVKCHAGVAHGNVASSGATMGGDFNKLWTAEAGARFMSTAGTSPKMDYCMDCHGRRGVTVACEACHSGSMKPESHLEKSFPLGHGKQAKKNIKYCDTCHAFIKAPGVTSKDLLDQEEDPVTKYLNSMQIDSSATNGYADYAKANEFCVDCHKKRPVTHNAEWPFIHGQEADKDQQRCMVCHSPRTDVKGTTQKAACSACHPSTHTNNPFRESHPIEIPPRLAVLPALCFQCHIKDVCGACHNTGNSKANDGKPQLPGVLAPPGNQDSASTKPPTGDQPPAIGLPSANNDPQTSGQPPNSDKSIPQVKVTITPTNPAKD